jgi:AbrB family looped-hinge helix DNA binding protein
MQERLGVITRKGQVTLPAEIRRSLGLKQGDRVAFRLEDGRVVLTIGESITNATAGVFRRYVDRPRTAEELRAAAEEAIAEEAAERSR